MRLDLGDISRVHIPVGTKIDYLVTGVICTPDSYIEGRDTIIRTFSDLLLYFNPSNKAYSRIKELVDSGYTVIIPKIQSTPEYSYLTPISDDLVMPCMCRSSGSGVELHDPRELDGGTYSVVYEYNPSEVTKKFFINLPTKDEVENEFGTSIYAWTIEEPDWVDRHSRVMNITLGEPANRDKEYTLAGLFNELSESITRSTPGVGFEKYVKPYLSKDSENYISKGEFKVYLNRPMNYIPRSLTPKSLKVRYGVRESIDLLQDYIPRNTVTFRSKVIGDCSDLHIMCDGELLVIEFHDIREEYIVSGNRSSVDYIGNIHSDLVEITVNTRKDIEIPKFDDQFYPIYSVTKIGSVEITANTGKNIEIPKFGDPFYPIYPGIELDSVSKSIDYLVDHDLEVNFIILDSDLVNFSIKSINTKNLTRELLIISDTKLNNLKSDLPNTIKFSGYYGNLPIYLKFLSNVYKCEFTEAVEGLVTNVKSDVYTKFNICVPSTQEYYSYLNLPVVDKLNLSIGLDLDRLTSYHVVYALMISQYILRYLDEFKFKINPIGKLNDRLEGLRSNFPIISDIYVSNSKITENKVKLWIESKFNFIYNFESVTLNFTINY